MGMQKQEYCRKGLHLLKGKNAVLRADGTRCCRTCRADYRRINRKEKEAERIKLRKLIDDVARY